MAPPFLKNISASASIWFIGIVVIVLTSVSMNILGPTLPLHTFLGWERVVFWLSAILIIFSLYGCVANTCSRSRSGDATYAPMWWFFSAGILFSSLLLYTSMQTSKKRRYLPVQITIVSEFQNSHFGSPKRPLRNLK